MSGQLVIIQLRGHTSATSRLQSGRARPPSGLLPLRRGGVSGNCALNISPLRFSSLLTSPLFPPDCLLFSLAPCLRICSSLSVRLLPLSRSLSFPHTHAPDSHPYPREPEPERAKSSDISAAHIALDGTQYVRRERQ